MLESISGTYAFEVPRNWKQTPTNHFLVAARVEFGTGNRHVPFFRSCPAWSSAWSSLNPGVTTGLKEAILEFFSWESLGAGSAGLRCWAGAAGWRTRSAKNMFIRHVLRHVEIKRV